MTKNCCENEVRPRVAPCQHEEPRCYQRPRVAHNRAVRCRVRKVGSKQWNRKHELSLRVAEVEAKPAKPLHESADGRQQRSERADIVEHIGSDYTVELVDAVQHGRCAVVTLPVETLGARFNQNGITLSEIPNFKRKVLSPYAQLQP